ncbi:hypothetical protein [uncultured Dokdonia sp.]|uniref:hypothetical protein n=1 Tax=uncultured Dokdonia sp. TaxID=575653 RepID=UPI00262BB253|nr:hypothetical protein [uncultured Dokdonia sp.]
MKKITTRLIMLLVFTAFTMVSCKQQQSNSKEKVETNKQVVDKSTLESITLEKLQGSPAYENAVLQMDTPKTSKISESGEVNFAFTVHNYDLKAQTGSSNSQLLANSDKGQHIHFILNNEPYSAHYEPTFEKGIPDGVHHLVAFLSRSYHESVKNENSVVVQKLEVGADARDTYELDMEAPTLIYSRPKGTYTGKDTENLLLDFFVLNTTLSENGNKVRATINDKEFIITEWAPQIIKGLPKGEVTIQLALIDAKGNLIPGMFNEVTRTITLKE